MKKKIDNIIFDLGGVLLNIDYNLTAQAFKLLGVTNFDLLYSQAKQTDVFDALETGKISPEDFRNFIRNAVPERILSDEQIDNAWNAMLLDLPKERIDLLKQLKKNYRIFLLSNTNAIHVKAFTKYIEQTFEKDLFLELFERVYYSNQIGRRKPDVETFNFVLNQNGLSPAKTLFIDDSIQHIEGAKQAGIEAHWLQKGEDIVSLFNESY